ncbi:SpoIID/LytB domain-containing protein [Mesobacillus sp. AQ2]|uniref:SpoIID/LytB domain-containing protein n=1 Tax=Mesobacillus sp. AQ2 TaxID=3043332 RepID=UPI0024C1A446|nr:SpoIID/LytB domain-containing protein [Mesobacillus sp. AQ2]WHX40249.1 SpoIID/LytB domain-containing protein [Mesobacillus sp. AQ2]
MIKKKISFILILAICVTLMPFTSYAQAANISVKLSNYIGNTRAINISTVGDYKLANGNIRMSGNDRFAVANNVASSGWSQADTVILVNYKAFADALAATPFAFYKNAPILLTLPNELESQTLKKIQELKPTNIFIIGGISSITPKVENQLKSYVPTVKRLGGDDRFAVAKKLADQLPNKENAVIANGLVFADALSIAPYAAKQGYPILLTAKDFLPDYTKDALQGRQSTLIVGGTGSVSTTVGSKLPSATRIGGADRFEVSANIVRELNLPADTAFISTGLSFADALTGSVLAAKQDAPLLLTRPERLPDSIKTIISEKKISSFTILGGPASVNESVVASLPNEVRLAAGSAYSVKNENSRLVLYKGSQKLKDFGNSEFALIPSRYNTSNQIKLNNKPYMGKMEFFLENGYVRPINREIPFEDYLKGVVPHEMPASWGVEALKAQAVAARTYSINSVGKVVADTQGFQVYGGVTWVDDYYQQRTNQAVEGTAGKVLRYNGNPISAVFSSSNGGYIESNANAWGTTLVPYLSAKADSYDPEIPWSIPMKKTQINMEPYKDNLKNPGHWWSSIKESDTSVANSIKNWLYKNGYANTEIKIVSINGYSLSPEKTSGNRSVSATLDIDFFVRYPSTNTYKLNSEKEIDRINLKRTLSIGTFRSMFGGSVFKSHLLDPVTYNKDTDIMTIRGKGYGHGVGMSQYGAKNMASSGKSYVEILKHYYPGATLGN